MTATRKEHDFLGDLEIPADVYYGIQTSRALENFRISGTTIASMPRFIQAFGYVKKAAALANMEQGGMRPSLVADEILRLAEKRDPAPVSAVGGKNVLLRISGRVLPERVTDFLVRRKFRLP